MSEIECVVERIVAAAIRDKAGAVHFFPAPHRHHHIINHMGDPTGSHEQGFVTSTGRFVNRPIAYQIATSNGQFTPDKVASGPKELFSEDLW